MARTWIFDLDNTLHNATPHIFPHISRSMTAYLSEHLALAPQAASELRMHYWQRYGATLTGLIRHHDIKPEHFLWHTHQFPELHRMVIRAPLLRPTLQALSGRKIVFSNSPKHYANAVLKLLKINDLFDDVFAIEHTRFLPKPHAAGFLRLLKENKLQPERCIMVEDVLENLRAAKKLGMKTVWVSDSIKRPAYVDVAISRLQHLPRLADRL